MNTDRRKWRRTTLLAGAALLLALGLTFRATDLILYNHSPSVPIGLYVRTDSEVERGAIVTVRAVDVAPAYARLRDFTDDDDRFIKRVAAQGGDQVCADSERIVVNGGASVRRSARDSSGRSPPTWSGCKTLQEDQLLLLGDTAESFDGRYWGPVSRSQIEGVWRPLAGSRH